MACRSQALDYDANDQAGAIGEGEILCSSSTSSTKTELAIKQEILIQNSRENDHTIPSCCKITETLIIDALVAHICKSQYSEEENQKKLFKVICNFLRDSEVFPELVGESSTAVCAYIQNRFEALLENAKVVVQNPENLNLVQQCSRIVNASQSDMNCDWHSNTRNMCIFNAPIYKTIFGDIKKIVEGGEGVVCQAKNVVDDYKYAIKIVPLKLHDKDYKARILNEAAILAQLNHPNIVNYKTSFLDHCSDPDFVSSSESSPSIISEESSGANNAISTENDIVELEKLVANKLCIPKTTSVCGNPIMFKRSMSCQDRRSTNYQSIALKQVPSQGVLVIQMELCTLREWLDKRRDGIIGSDVFSVVDEIDILTKLTAILSAIEYIHDVKNLIHRDLKPSNIVFDNNHQPKIADFGLAKIHDKGVGRKNRHTPQVGTLPYAAPEQLNSETYDSKADMYSLGLIIFEMYHPFASGTERAKCFEKAKNMILPTEFQERFPSQASLIRNLLSMYPDSRPTAKEVSLSLSMTIQQNVPKLEDKTCESKVQELRRKVRDLEKENRDLKMLLNKYRVVEKENKIPTELKKGTKIPTELKKGTKIPKELKNENIASNEIIKK